MNRDFMLLWLGKTISQLGDKFYAIALSWWILQTTGSPSVMGLFLLTSILPGLLLGFYSGAIADRLMRKTIIITTDLLRGGLVLAVSCLAFAGTLQVWHVFLIGFCLSLVTSFFDPAMQAIIPQIVPKDKLKKANGMSQMVTGACTVAGPLLGAVAVSVLGLKWVFLFNSVSYFLSALMACPVRVSRGPNRGGGQASIMEEILEGFLFIKSSRRITFVLKTVAVAHLFMGSLTVTLPFLSSSLGGVNILGLLEMMMGAGLFAGSAFLGMKKKAAQTHGSLVAFLFLAGCCFFMIGIFQFLNMQLVFLYMLFMALIGVFIAGASVYWQTLLQKDTPEHMTGRVFSISTLIGNASLPLANALFGVLLNVSSIPVLLTGCGLILMVICALLYTGLTKARNAAAG